MAEKYSHDEVKQKVIDLLCDISGEDDVADNMDTDLFEEGYLDSMGAIELLVALEDELDVSIAPTEVDRSEMNTPNLIIKQVEKRLD
ncbi:MAG: D-alanine--poly(phosphoribitol) ligase subunit DltC [Coriobacteriaceae bacterium]|jgi:D-alanine--poly(phosphoribitol) ligase subunit 2|uniref:D-alanine--poly(phosphoribitol) ligase subunit DltC n=1 Tax=Olsenella TaxID=133925 RepID=UPI000FF5749E|nr:D-alanine--poly(phosphoribitol) ligase subunit DltC [Atopobium sp.]MCH4081420.1 D-alanine--poly(phosphoribitol) ligase subunit DltC [Atopobiaceae bacterium]MCI6263360.1 D-alanine--poly(phosphoribitol) ligase subunit DltC [Olsenella sp.]RRF95002.1 MAG: D-alanine--poly(phosphoribitol) ligase subunit DltC [Coriobacteriaceae bacterium]MCI1343971.1 D-alanine--poly(phosphoribitol) ligase subunit DltC [Atopobiaceae bacterium]